MGLPVSPWGPLSCECRHWDLTEGTVMVHVIRLPVKAIALRAVTAVSIILPLSAILLLAGFGGCMGPGPGEQPERHIVPTATAISAYLDENLLSPAFGGRVFTAHEILGADAEGIYIWVYAQEFYKTQGTLTKGTGLSCPAVLIIDSQGGQPKVIGHRLPRDGSLYTQDVSALFPSKIQRLIKGVEQGQTIPEMSNLVEEKAKEWFD